jgi:hypothetical protein
MTIRLWRKKEDKGERWAVHGEHIREPTYEYKMWLITYGKKSSEGRRRTSRVISDSIERVLGRGSSLDFFVVYFTTLSVA